MRQLTKHTQESAEQIRGLNGRFKSARYNAVEMMPNGHEHTQSSAQSAQEARSYIHEIFGQVNCIMNMNTMVATAVKEQSAVAEDMNRNISNISKIAEEISQGANETATTSQNLAELARSLEKHVSTFRI